VSAHALDCGSHIEKKQREFHEGAAQKLELSNLNGLQRCAGHGNSISRPKMHRGAKSTFGNQRFHHLTEKVRTDGLVVIRPKHTDIRVGSHQTCQLLKRLGGIRLDHVDARIGQFRYSLTPLLRVPALIHPDKGQVGQSNFHRRTIGNVLGELYAFYDIIEDCSMAKLLILSSDTGEGHNSAAEAIQATASAAGFQVSIRKPIEESGKFNRVLGGLYNTILARRPQWMGNYFWLVDHCRPNEREFLYPRIRKFIAEFVESEKPDTLLSVHPMLNHFIQRYIKESGLNIPCHTFLTDPFPPFWKGWASPWVDRYFVPTDEALQALTAMGVAAWRIERVPMPVRSLFRPMSEEDRSAFRREFDLKGRRTILLNGGARGGGPLAAIHQAIRRGTPDAEILVICGRNEVMQKRIESLGDPGTRTFGFVRDIHRFIGGSDLVLTKPGALSTYEALACAVPVLLLGIRGLMPQESGLFHAARHYEFGFAASQLSDVEAVVGRGQYVWDQIRGSLAAFYKTSSGEELIERIQHLHAVA
jgi:processive 1,2-diacylglycerol beta-glucosyltransferase